MVFSIVPWFGRNVIENFLGSLSVDINKISSELKKGKKSKGGYEEYYEQTPFIRFLFIKHGNKFPCIHPYVLYRRLEYFIYDVLREDDPSGMMASFSKIFEKYLSRGLDYSRQDYLREDELRSLIPRDIKCVDYLIAESAANIFIDAKAVEMHYFGKISGNPEIILGKIKNTALSAIEQANRLNEYLYHHSEGNLPRFKDKSYLLVVTCKELYLGSGESLYEAIAKYKIDTLFESIDEDAIIGLKNTYFINIDQFDFLMSISKEKSVPVSELLHKVISDDQVSTSRKFTFSQHISSFGVDAQIPDYIRREVDDTLSTFKSML